ncbi:NADP-binding protein [Dacryopinax primogenitus]|uniref:NADP-binding protein n=1 Tax=Dacryopinax primogenitus (strain DJM 731) TaxID=1858805 RepID=M5GBR5_DACPD|nr:NADP-binding protein [Dacryopinax primogenitus]EJU05875.1 NADP-binding protein [Dacryopinax primogenitus]
MSATVYLISGANRGIGLGMVAQLAARDNVLVVAGVRRLDTGVSELHALQARYPGKIRILKLLSTDKPNNEAAMAEIKKDVGRLDVVIANAGICSEFAPTLELSADAIREHHEVNVLGPLILFQCAYPLLSTTASAPKFVVISAGMGSFAIGPSILANMTAYGMSKAAVNWVAAKLHYEHPELGVFSESRRRDQSDADKEAQVTLAIHPGVVDTDMATTAINNEPLLIANAQVITVEECKGYVDIPILTIYGNTASRVIGSSDGLTHSGWL